MACVSESRRWLLALLLVLSAAARVSAQAERAFPDFDSEPGWVEQLTKGGLRDWTTDGEEKGDPDGWVLGGMGPASMTPNLPLGNEFKVWLEFKFTGPDLPHVDFTLGGHTNKIALPYHKRGDWMNVVLVGKRGPRGRGHHLSVYYAFDAGQSRGDLLLAVGNERLESVGFSVNGGTTLTLRRVRFQNSPRSAAPAPSGVMMPLLLLASLLAAVMIVGWLLNRRAAKPR